MRDAGLPVPEFFSFELNEDLHDVLPRVSFPSVLKPLTGALGTRLTEKDLRVTAWPKSAPLQGGFSDPAEIIGRGVIVPMGPNEPVLDSKLA